MVVCCECCGGVVRVVGVFVYAGVVYEDVEVAVVGFDLVGERLDLIGL